MDSEAKSSQLIVDRDDVRHLDALIASLRAENPLHDVLPHVSHVLNSLPRHSETAQRVQLRKQLREEDAMSLHQAARAATYEAEKARSLPHANETRRRADVLEALARRVSAAIS